MADVKISALPIANTPLDGSEVLPIVQSTTTKKVSIANVTAGRALSASSLSLTTTPLGVSSGGTGTSTLFTSGSIVFAGTSGVYNYNDNRFVWDNTNYRLGVNTNSPAVTLAVSGTDAILVPVGSTVQRPSGAQGYIRFNTTLSNFEGYDGSNWRSVGGGAAGGGTNQIFYLNDQTVTDNYTLAATKNAGTFGPVTINAGVTVTVETGATWTVV
jgi:hypothetical protein